MSEHVMKLHLLWCFTYPKRKGVGDHSMTTSRSSNRKPGGWKAMPYIIGNETFERLATTGLLQNFEVYLLNQLHVPQIRAANVANIWLGTTNFSPLVGAFLSDAYLGRFRTLAYACIATFIGLLGLTLTSAIPQLKPPPCRDDLIQKGMCKGPPRSMVALLFLSLGFLTIGAGGIRPCNLPFGADQFDATTEQGRKGISSFFNWYYFTVSFAIVFATTVIVYVQDSVSWTLGLGIPTVLMLVAIVLFFLGMRVYIYVPPMGSVFTGVAQAAVAAYRKRSLKLPTLEEEGEVGEPLVFYDPMPPKGSTVIAKLPLTQQFRFLNKAAVIQEGELKEEDNGSPRDPWRLCSIQKVEELKCLLRIAPIVLSGIICFLSLAQLGTFCVLQALKMQRHLGHSFQIPPGSLSVIAMLPVIVFIPVYDRVLVPALANFTGHEGGITMLQRIGVWMAMSVLSMAAAGLVEGMRREKMVRSGVRVTVMWLSPQLALMGLSEAFVAIAQLEFYYKEFPEHMRSVAVSLYFCSVAGSNYLGSLLVVLVKRYSGGGATPNWLDNDIDVGRLDYYYYLLAALGFLNCLYFVACARWYRYKEGEPAVEGKGEGSRSTPKEMEEGS